MFILERKSTSTKKASKLIKASGGKSLVSFLLFLLILALYLFSPMPVLQAVDFEKENELGVFPLRENRFCIGFTHSVELTPVEDCYHVEGKKIILTDTWFRSLGAGLPADTAYDFEATPEGFHIYNIDQEIPELVYRTGQVRAHHQLILPDHRIPMENFSQPGEAVKFQISSWPRIKVWFWRWQFDKEQ